MTEVRDIVGNTQTAAVQKTEGGNVRNALIVGVNYYQHGKPLFGCVSDAHAVKSVLSRHGDGSINFDTRMFTASTSTDQVTRKQLKDAIGALFAMRAESALFYFAGHGHIETTGGYLLTSECERGDDGLAVSEVLTLANSSKATNRLIVLDSCHSGIAGARPVASHVAEIAEGVTILTASTAEQYASESEGVGLFTGLFVDALTLLRHLSGPEIRIPFDRLWNSSDRVSRHGRCS